MNLEHFNELLLDSVGVGLAIVEPDSLEIVFHNKRFSEWFGDVPAQASLPSVIPSVDVARLRKRLERGRPYSTETSRKAGRREVSLGIEVQPSGDTSGEFLVIECRNISKLKELEYMIESYSSMVEKQNRTLQREKERAERLLLNIMPKKVYEELKAFGVTTPRRFEQASILMLDFVNFTELSEGIGPAALVAELNEIFTAFDQIVEQFGCERIKTIGDAYMAVSGVPEAATDHARNIAKVALLLVRYIERRNSSHSRRWECRVGINSGPVIGSIVGIQKYVYDIFGPAVNLASRLEQLAEPMEVVLSEDMYPLIRDDFRFEDQGEVEIKGVGPKRIYTLTGEGRPSPVSGGWRSSIPIPD